MLGDNLDQWDGERRLKMHVCVCVCVCVCYSLSRVQLFVTPWTVSRQAPLSVGFSNQEYWSGLPFPSSEHLPNPQIKPRSPAFQAGSIPRELPGKHYMAHGAEPSSLMT